MSQIEEETHWRRTKILSIYKYCSALYDSYRKHAKDEVPDGLIAVFFLMTLVEPLGISPDEIFALQLKDEEISNRDMKYSGEIVGRMGPPK